MGKEIMRDLGDGYYDHDGDEYDADSWRFEDLDYAVNGGFKTTAAEIGKDYYDLTDSDVVAFIKARFPDIEIDENNIWEKDLDDDGNIIITLNYEVTITGEESEEDDLGYCAERIYERTKAMSDGLDIDWNYCEII